MAKLVLHKTFLRNTIDREWAPLAECSVKSATGSARGGEIVCIMLLYQKGLCTLLSCMFIANSTTYF
jgi:hypothetical protein